MDFNGDVLLFQKKCKAEDVEVMITQFFKDKPLKLVIGQWRSPMLKHVAAVTHFSCLVVPGDQCAALLISTRNTHA